ncbi:hypothetical protein WOLCODRAFT_150041 [Wolfiporia cocos MD-104 SS10]|uniref:Uncharacterized protein n=1 Tax=Wolfiporia cocos (strain MD-104) TaxID=742152 RepID=A0A2H3JMF6_WOLCO|nr:hypothetical protein WOLCODRAFT_150041 [Wolfiporia cocos MD-104 SS10]
MLLERLSGSLEPFGDTPPPARQICRALCLAAHTPEAAGDKALGPVADTRLSPINQAQSGPVYLARACPLRSRRPHGRAQRPLRSFVEHTNARGDLIAPEISWRPLRARQRWENASSPDNL